MKIKFELNQMVATPTSIGVITDSKAFEKHTEYLVAFEDKTATWIHEDLLKPVTVAPPEPDVIKAPAAPAAPANN